MPVRDQTWSELLFVALFGAATGWTTGFLVRLTQNNNIVWPVAVGTCIVFVAYRQGYIRGTFQADFDRLNADLPPFTIVTGLVFVGSFILGINLA